MNFAKHIHSITIDAIVWLCMHHWSNANTAIEQSKATAEIVHLLADVPNEINRNSYVKDFCNTVKKHNSSIDDTIKIYEKRIKSIDNQIKRTNDDGNKKNYLDEINQINELINVELGKKLSDISKAELLSFIKSEIENRVKEKKEKQKNIFNNLSDEIEAEDLEDDENPWLKAPKWMDVEDVKKHGFCVVDERDKFGDLKRFGYYSYNPAEKKHQEITNFSIQPIFHIREGRDSRHLIQIDNGYKKVILDVESKAMVSIETMQMNLVNNGNFVIYGSKIQYLRVASKLLQDFKECYSIKVLGWQRYGMYAFVNKVYIPGIGLKELDEWGIINHENTNYLIAASSPVYRELQFDDDDPYENERALSYITSDITFNEWVSKMKRVYEDKGIVGVAYCILCTFRDIAFNIDNNFPHLYAFGERSSGKSKFAESCGAFFYHKRPAFNLNSGTDFAFFSYMGKFRNSIALLNEFDEKVIKPEWFQNIKGVFDGESRQRGSMTSKNKVESQKVESGLLLTGQYLVTMDDNSVVTRSLIEPFSERSLTEDDKKAYIDLKTTEEKGITSLITELLQHRSYFKDKYKEMFNNTISDWRSIYTNNGNFNQRIMQNWAHLYTSMALASNRINIQCVDIQYFKNYCFNKASQWCQFIRSSDTLSEFWNTLQFLSESNQVITGWDFRIVTSLSVTIRRDKDSTEELNFTSPTKVLYLRLNNIHKLYQESYKRRSGKEAMSMENLLHYFKSRSYFIGPVKNFKFKNSDKVKTTNAYAFYYDQLEIDLEVMSAAEAYSKDERDKSNNNEENIKKEFEKIIEDLDWQS